MERINNLALHNHAIELELRVAIDRVLASGYYLMGNELDAFEKEFARYCGVEHCLGVSWSTESFGSPSGP